MYVLQRPLRVSQMPAAGLSENRDGFLNAGQGVGGALLLLEDVRHEMARDARLNAPDAMFSSHSVSTDLSVI